MTITPVRDAAGVIANFAAIKQDVTRRKRAEKALCESEERYRSLFARGAAGVMRTTEDGRLLECNQAMANILGYESPERFPSQSVLDFYYSQEERTAFLEKLRGGGGLTNFEMRMRRKDGSPTWLLANVSLRTPATNSPSIIESTFIDISAHKRAEKALRRSEEKYRSLIGNIPDVVWTASSAGGVVFVSPNIESLSGFTLRRSTRAARICSSHAYTPKIFTR